MQTKTAKSTKASTILSAAILFATATSAFAMTKVPTAPSAAELEWMNRASDSRYSSGAGYRSDRTGAAPAIRFGSYYAQADGARGPQGPFEDRQAIGNR